jgi:hypothetical protein
MLSIDAIKAQLCKLLDSTFYRVYIFLIYTVSLKDKCATFSLPFRYIISCRVSRSGKLTFNTCFAIYRIHLRRARIYYIYSLYIQSGSERVVSPDQVNSLLTRASLYTEFTFDAPEVLYIILIYITSRCSFHLYTPILLGTFYNLLLVTNLLLFNHDYSILDIYTSFFKTITYQD